MNGTILIYGNEVMLLATRQLILERARYEVFSATKLDGARSALLNEPINVMLLCQSLRDEERSSILETARAIKPDIKTVTFSFDGLEIVTDNELALRPLIGPATLVKTISRLVQNESPPQI